MNGLKVFGKINSNMRLNRPRNWILMTEKEKDEWYRTEGKRQQELYTKHIYEFENHIKNLVNRKEGEK